MERPPAGLCDGCAHQRLVRTTRGSEFSLCERSRTDAAYPRYPRVPVVECAGFESGSSTAARVGYASQARDGEERA